MQKVNEKYGKCFNIFYVDKKVIVNINGLKFWWKTFFNKNFHVEISCYFFNFFHKIYF